MEPSSTFASGKLIVPLFKSLLRIRKQREDTITAIGNQFDDPMELARFYIEPRCQHYNPADSDEDKEVIAPITSPVFEIVNEFFNKEGVSLTGGHNQQLILADAGMGKTALLVMLKLFHWSNFWPSKYTCELLKLGTNSLKKIDAIPDRANTILLLDSLDEDPRAWNRLNDRLIEILDATNNFKRVIISCRTQFFPDGENDPFKRLGKLELGGYVCPMFYLSPFSDIQVDIYLRKRFPPNIVARVRGQKSIKHIKALPVVHSMTSLRMRPFLLANIPHLLEVDSSVSWNEYNVYKALVTQWLNREEIRIRKLRNRRSNQPLSSDETPTKDELFNACTIVARWMYERQKRHLLKSDFRKLVQTVPNIVHIDELENGSQSLMNKDSNGAFRFSHFSVQEFLVAESLSASEIANIGELDGWSNGLTDQALVFLYQKDRRLGNFDVAHLQSKIHVIKEMYCTFGDLTNDRGLLSFPFYHPANGSIDNLYKELSISMVGHPHLINEMFVCEFNFKDINKPTFLVTDLAVGSSIGLNANYMADRSDLRRKWLSEQSEQICHPLRKAIEESLGADYIVPIEGTVRIGRSNNPDQRASIEHWASGNSIVRADTTVFADYSQS